MPHPPHIHTLTVVNDPVRCGAVVSRRSEKMFPLPNNPPYGPIWRCLDEKSAGILSVSFFVTVYTGLSRVLWLRCSVDVGRWVALQKQILEHLIASAKHLDGPYLASLIRVYHTSNAYILCILCGFQISV